MIGQILPLVLFLVVIFALNKPVTGLFGWAGLHVTELS